MPGLAACPLYNLLAGLHHILAEHQFGTEHPAACTPALHLVPLVGRRVSERPAVEGIHRIGDECFHGTGVFCHTGFIVQGFAIDPDDERIIDRLRIAEILYLEGIAGVHVVKCICAVGSSAADFLPKAKTDVAITDLETDDLVYVPAETGFRRRPDVADNIRNALTGIVHAHVEEIVLGYAGLPQVASKGEGPAGSRLIHSLGVELD